MDYRQMKDAVRAARDRGDYDKAEELLQGYYENYTGSTPSVDPSANKMFAAIWNGSFEWYQEEPK